jgi:hypothetical protein
MQHRGRPVGAVKCAERLAERLGRVVEADDIRVLAEQGHLEVVDTYTPPDGLDAHALFDPALVDRITDEILTAAITARVTGAAGTVGEDEAAKMLGWTAGQFRIAMYAKKIQPNPVTRTDVEALAADTEFREQVLRLGPS